MSDPRQKLLSKAINGDEVALQTLLVELTSRLTAHAKNLLPSHLRDAVDPDDIVQQTYVETFRSIANFRLEEGTSFAAWVQSICTNVVRDTIKHQKRIKRGGEFQRVAKLQVTNASVARDLVEILSAGGHSPSQSAMGHEAVDAVQVALRGLPDDYRQAVQLHLLEGKTLDETAQLMNRSPRSVQGLLDRSRKKLRDALDRLSKYK